MNNYALFHLQKEYNKDKPNTTLTRTKQDFGQGDIFCINMHFNK